MTKSVVVKLKFIKIVALCALFFACSSLFEMSFAKYLFTPLYYYDLTQNYINDIYMIFKQIIMILISLIYIKFLNIKLTSKEEKENNKYYIAFIILFLIFTIILSQVSTFIYFQFVDNYKYKILANSKPILDVTESGIDYYSVIRNAILQCIMVPIAQELFFRKVIYQYLRTTYGFYFSAIVSSIAFSVVHQEIISTFFLSVFLCYIFERFGFYGSVIIHIIHNLFILIIHILYFLLFDSHLNLVLRSSETTAFMSFILITLSTLLVLIMYKNVYQVRD